MACSLCFIKNPLRMAFLVPVLVCAGCGFLPMLLTTFFFILSYVFYISSKNKPVPVATPVKDDITFYQAEEAVSSLDIEGETITQYKKAQGGEVDRQPNGYIMMGLVDSVSESEIIDPQSYSSTTSTDQDSEVEWPYASNAGPSPDWSDGSISDEESLIEIALNPSGSFVEWPKKEEPRYNFQQKFAGSRPELIFKQYGLMELLAEVSDMNEEDNLIEIDISMGSIKCSRFEPF